MKSKKKVGENNKIIQLDELSWKQIEAVDKTKAVVFIPLSPLEEHGPHLPVGTDIFTARDAAKEAIKRLANEYSNITCLLFPAIPLGYSKVTQGFPGSVSTPVKTVKQVVFDVCSSLAVSGFRYFVICTYHLDLGHLKGVYAGMQKAMKRYDIMIAEPWGPYFFSKEVEKREPKVGFDTKKELHGGFRETSLMKYQYPYLVDESYKQLPSVYRDVYSPRALGKTFKDLGLKQGYIGSPARADSNYGRWFFHETVDTYVQAAIALVDGKTVSMLPSRVKLMMKSLFWI